MAYNPMTHPSPEAVEKTDDATLAFARKYAEVTRRSKYHDNADVAVLALDAHVTALTAQLEAERARQAEAEAEANEVGIRYGFANAQTEIADLNDRLTRETARAYAAVAEAKAQIAREMIARAEGLLSETDFDGRIAHYKQHAARALKEYAATLAQPAADGGK